MKFFLHLVTSFDAIILSYSVYRINFKAIRNDHFDLVCRRIRPDQVISLIISDDNDTPGLSESFFSCFSIEQFIQLRSLTLIQIEIDSLKLIFPNLYKLNQLRSFSFNIAKIRHKYPIWNNDYSNEFIRLKSLLFETYTQILPQLNHIDLNHSTDLVSFSLPYLRHLKLLEFSEDDLKIIFQKSSQLKSLDIVLHMNVMPSQFILPPNQLIRLNLKIEIRCIFRDEMEQFLSNLPHLKYFNLEMPALWDVVNGHFWQRLAGSFVKFNFKFSVLKIRVHQTLDSFRTPFWLEEKRWFVGYYDSSLFSLPYFIPNHMQSANLLSFHSTAPDHSFIYKHLNKFTINSILKNTNLCLTHVKTLIIEYSISFKNFEFDGIDLNQVEHLVVVSLDKLLTIMPLEYVMPHLKKLTVKNRITIEMIERIRCCRFEQILILEIRINNEYKDCIIEELFRLFPCLEHLIYNSSVESVGMMIRLMNGFKNLSNASFCADSSFFRKERKFVLEQNSIIQNLRRELHYDNIKCRVYHIRNTQLPLSIHWKIEKQSFIHLSLMNRLWRQGYYWYRLKYILSRVSYKNLLSIQYFMQVLIYLPIIIIILRPYYTNLDNYFLCFCLINTIFVTIFYNVFYRLSLSIKNDNDYIVLACKVCVWFVYCVLVFLVSLVIQIIYDYIFY